MIANMSHVDLLVATYAEFDCIKVVALDRDMPEPHSNLGIVWLAGGVQKGAEQARAEPIRIQPDCADAHNNLGNLLSGSGDFEQAQYHFEMALRLRPEDAATRYNFAMALRKRPIRRGLVGEICGIRSDVRRRITGGSLRNRLQALMGRPDGIERVSGPNVHLAFADCRSCVDIRVEFIDRQNLPIAGSTQHDDFAMLAGDVNLAVDADG